MESHDFAPSSLWNGSNTKEKSSTEPTNQIMQFVMNKNATSIKVHILILLKTTLKKKKSNASTAEK